jgi:hypothetical protein
MPMDMRERRKTPRYRAGTAGAISYGRYKNIECSVRDLSLNGACIELVSPIETPAAFVLSIKGRHVQLSCRAIWRSGKRIGVRFA